MTTQDGAEKLARRFSQLAMAARGKRFVFLLMGRTGVGKSSTVNNLIGKNVAPVGDYEATTMSVERYDSELDGVNFTVIDTPGLCDDVAEAANDAKYLEMVRENVKSLDCLWFVSRLDETRVSADEKRGISLISKAFGPDIWGRALIVFTFAGKVEVARFQEALKMRGDLIRKEIAKSGAAALADSVPAIAVDNRSEKTPDGKPWLGELYTKVWARIDKAGAMPFLLATMTSIKPSKGADSASEQPRIILSPEQKREVIKSIDAKIIPGLALVGAGLGAAFGPVGAAVGGVVGAAAGMIAWLFD